MFIFRKLGTRRLCSRKGERYHQRSSVKTVHRTVFLTHRLQHSRLASCINALPQTPCCGSSSNSLFPPPAAVVLVTSSPVFYIIYINKQGTLMGTLFVGAGDHVIRLICAVFRYLIAVLIAESANLWSISWFGSTYQLLQDCFQRKSQKHHNRY